MNTFIDKLDSKFEQKHRIRRINLQGHIPPLWSSSPSNDKRKYVESLLESLLDPKQSYLFRHRRRGHEAITQRGHNHEST